MGTKPTYNLHSHTYRCGHARGRDEEYVMGALEAGYKTLGFSDHIMLPFATHPGIRGDFSLTEDYISSVNALREKYKDKIQILVGFEAEWYHDRSREYYPKLLARDDFDYMILGQHCYYDERERRLRWYGDLPLGESALRYVEDLIEGMESGLYTYVAHPDLYCAWQLGWNDLCAEVAHRIAKKAEELRMPLEINCAPSRSYPLALLGEDDLPYPVGKFWDIVAQYDIPVVLGVDAHAPTDYSRTVYNYFLRFAKKHNIEFLQECPVKLKR